MLALRSQVTTIVWCRNGPLEAGAQSPYLGEGLDSSHPPCGLDEGYYEKLFHYGSESYAIQGIDHSESVPEELIVKRTCTVAINGADEAGFFTNRQTNIVSQTKMGELVKIDGSCRIVHRCWVHAQLFQLFV